MDEKEMIVFLVEGEGIKGRKVIDTLCNDFDFKDKYELRIVSKTKGKTTEILEKEELNYIITDNPKNPDTAIEKITDDRQLDYLVACGWSSRIPQSIIEKPAIWAINCHSSYLPDYKGLSVHRAMWANAEEYGGASIHYLTKDFDQGNIIIQKKFDIGLFDTPLDIAKKYSKTTAAILPEALKLAKTGYGGKSNSGGRYYSKISWSRTLFHGLVNHLLRALNTDYRWEIKP